MTLADGCLTIEMPYVDESLNEKVVHCEAHQNLAREIAEMVRYC